MPPLLREASERIAQPLLGIGLLLQQGGLFAVRRVQRLDGIGAARLGRQPASLGLPGLVVRLGFLGLHGLKCLRLLDATGGQRRAQPQHRPRDG